MDKIGLYIHVPFCNGKCPYCDFYSIYGDDNIMDLYVDAVCNCLNKWSNRTSSVADTLYIGGGTPSLLGADRLCRIVEIAKRNFNIHNGEITIEINPGEGRVLDFEKLFYAGVNRLSIGLQSSNDNELKILGRRHNVNDVKDSILLAKKAGFNNISLDLMIGICEQTEESLKNSIEFCASQNVQHISSYILKIEEGTKFFEQKNKLSFPDEDKISYLYLLMCNELEKRGYKQYEISNFSLIDKQSKHNLKYWNSESYIGIGPSAHSFLKGDRFYYNSDIYKFIDLEEPIYDCKGGNEEEYIMLKLRLSSGLNNEEFNKKFGYDIPLKYYEKANVYEKYNLLKINNGSIFLTSKGFLLSNKIISDIIF